MEYIIIKSDELYHHGIKGQKWGVRRFQNEDGSVTPAGAERYYTGNKKYDKKIARVEKQQSKIMAAREKNRAKIMSKYDKKAAKIQADIDSYEPIKEGLPGLLTKEFVQQETKALTDKLNAVRQKQAEAAKNWDEASKSVEAGYNRYKQTIKAYSDAKAMKMADSAYKDSPEYRQAVSDFIKQRNNDFLFGQGQTVLGYVADDVRRRA